MEQQKNKGMRKTKSLSALVLTTAAALAFSGCGNDDQMKTSNLSVENNSTNIIGAYPGKPYAASYTNNVQQTQQQNHSSAFPFFWWYMIGRSHSSPAPAQNNYIAPRAPISTYNHVSTPSTPSHVSTPAPSVSRGGFGSIGRGASGGIGS